MLIVWLGILWGALDDIPAIRFQRREVMHLQVVIEVELLPLVEAVAAKE